MTYYSPEVSSGNHSNNHVAGTRLFYMNGTDGGWFFRAREGLFGPYTSAETAEQALFELIADPRPAPRERYRNLWLKLKA